MYFYRFSSFLQFIVLAVLLAAPVYGQRARLQGTVVDASTGMPLQGAHVYLQSAGIGTVTFPDGRFTIPRVPLGECRLVASYMGYVPYNLVFALRSDTTLSILLSPASLAVPEVQIVARRVERNGSALQVGQEALEYIQPNSLGDVLQFLPGHLSTDGRLHEVQQVQLRQAGSDENTALGTAIMEDGVPISNNANLQLLTADQKSRERSLVNRGIDLRMLSTDHYQEVEVVRGIASARYGDLTAGMIALKPKRGVSPWTVRAKSDPLTKLGYLGKGFPVGRGTLYTGVEFTYATPDERTVLESYSRYSGQANYTVALALGDTPLELGIRASYVGTLQRDRHDADLVKRMDTYRAHYTRYRLSANVKITPGYRWLHTVALQLAGDYTEDVLRRAKTVVLHGSVALPINQQAGEHEGIYLPYEYLSNYSLVSKPLLGYAKLELTTPYELFSGQHTLNAGTEFRIEKNLGAGACYSISTPPAPGSPTSSRPRRYSDVPAYIPLSAWLEGIARWRKPWGGTELSIGLRLSDLLNVDARYHQLRRAYLEPRINAAYTFPCIAFRGYEGTLTLRGGWGLQTKWPTLDMLSPELAYFDFLSLNYFSQNPANRLLIITTFIEDRRNFSLRASTVAKWEAGFEMHLGLASLSATLFCETLNSGFTYRPYYLPYTYNDYSQKPYTGGGKPHIEDLTAVPERRLEVVTRPSNGERTVKQGVEYRLSLPKLRWLQTSVELSGAWFRTVYDTSEPVEYRPSHTTLGGRPYPYVGIYAWSGGSQQQLSSTQLWFNTHLSAVRLVFTTMLQAVWFTEYRTLPTDGMPLYYRDLDGSLVPFTPDMASHSELRHLVRTYSEGYFDPDREPFELTVNLKVTKEIGRFARLSFFVNRIAGLMPDYRAKYNLLIRRSYSPFFGAEVKLII